MKKRNVDEGDKLILKAAPASIYHRMDGEEVTVMSIFIDDSQKKPLIYYGFFHPKHGSGTMLSYGFCVPTGSDFKLHHESEKYDREEVMTRLVGRIKAQKHIFKFSIPYKENKVKIDEYEAILCNNFGFTRESLDAIYEGL